jgi:hypothetical protein
MCKAINNSTLKSLWFNSGYKSQTKNMDSSIFQIIFWRAMLITAIRKQNKIDNEVWKTLT